MKCKLQPVETPLPPHGTRLELCPQLPWYSVPEDRSHVGVLRILKEVGLVRPDRRDDVGRHWGKTAWPSDAVCVGRYRLRLTSLFEMFQPSIANQDSVL